jgi:hypothetical protein
MAYVKQLILNGLSFFINGFTRQFSLSLQPENASTAPNSLARLMQDR